MRAWLLLLLQRAPALRAAADLPPFRLARVGQGVADRHGAKCLDGSTPAFYYRPGTTSRFIIFLEGGGWCGNNTDHHRDDCFDPCDQRAPTDWGSSDHLLESVPEYGGLLSANSSANPGFSEDHHIFVTYCDGSSFTSEREEQALVRGKPVWLRGRANLAAVLDTLLEERFGLARAEEVVLSGGSAGGVAVVQNVDWVRATLRKTVGSALRSVVGFADTGMFLETPPSPSALDWAPLWERASNFWGTTGGLAGCAAAHSGEEWRCLLSEHALPHVESKLFVLNSDIDLWYADWVLNIGCFGFPPHSPWPPVNCTAAQVDTLGALRHAWRTAFLPGLARNGNGAYVDTCIVHEQNILRDVHADGRHGVHRYMRHNDVHRDVPPGPPLPVFAGWGTYRASPSGRTPQQAFHTWYFEQGGRDEARRDGHFFTLDGSALHGEKSNPSCVTL